MLFRSLHKQADALERANPGMKIKPGTSNLLIPEAEYNRIMSQKILDQKQYNEELLGRARAAAELRKQRLKSVEPTAGSKITEAALRLGKAETPSRFMTGYNVADLLQAQNPFEASVSAVGAAAPYATSKLAKAVPPKIGRAHV